MASTSSLHDLNGTVQSTPQTSPEITWIGTSYRSGFSPRLYVHWQAGHIDPQLCSLETRGQSSSPAPAINLTPRGLRAQRRDAAIHKAVVGPNVQRSPRSQRASERLKRYQLTEQSKFEMRRIINVIQSKRRDEFRVLREALGQIVNYKGQYLQAPGEKQLAAHILRLGGLGHEFVHMFDNDAKWAWLQIRVNNL
ncbi:hypothetical protein DFH28DRAFT_1134554 [Melampsora americana]|nr:hypothetical protein DFH28DRAFT_1134554 [Melampsora americana]